MACRKIRSAVITGPTGAIGQALCEKLLAEKCLVFAVTHPGSNRAQSLPRRDRLRVIVCDAQSYHCLPERIGEPVDAFFHLAWSHTSGPYRNDLPAQIQNIHFSILAVRAAAALGCQVFVGAGSQAEYGRVAGLLRPDTPTDPENGYGMAKLCAGQMSRLECARLGLDHIWARVLSVYGPHDGPNSVISSTIRQLLQCKRPPLTAGQQQWDYLYEADAADAFWRMAINGRNGAVYPLGSGVSVPLREYICQLRDAINPGLPLGFGELPYAPNQVMHLQADILPLQRDTGFHPNTPFSDGIRKTIQWIRSNGI